MEASTDTNLHSCDRSRTLVIMAKAPQPGMVKTRLARSLSLAAVTSLYRCLLQDTVALAESLGGVQVAIMCPATDVEDLAQLLGAAIQIVAQKGAGLAAGLTSVFAHFAAHGRQHVIAFNSDSPHLPSSVLEQAFKTLASHDLVIGPTHDGGYYLVGANNAHPTLFANDGLGTANALQGLLERARMLELSLGFTDPFYDIDVAGDLNQLGAELRIAPERAPRTAAWFVEWGHEAATSSPAAGKL